MTLDLDMLTAEWQHDGREVCARFFTAPDNVELIQLRVELGVLQMLADGRPDGASYHGHSGVIEHIQHELRLGATIDNDDWEELEREFTQHNYRRIALAALAEDAVQSDNRPHAINLLQRTIRDIERCLLTLRLMQEHLEDGAGSNAAMIPALVFNHARLTAKRFALMDQANQSIAAIERGLEELTQCLSEAGFDESQVDCDPGIGFLRQTGQRLRAQFGIEKSLQEQLDDAIRSEDFREAARIRDQMRGAAEKPTQPKKPRPREN